MHLQYFTIVIEYSTWVNVLISHHQFPFFPVCFVTALWARGDPRRVSLAKVAAACWHSQSKWAIRPQSLGSVCCSCRRLKMEGNSLVLWIHIVHTCCMLMCMFAQAACARFCNQSRRLMSPVNCQGFFLHRSEIAAGAMSRTGGDQLGWDELGMTSARWVCFLTEGWQLMDDILFPPAGTSPSSNWLPTHSPTAPHAPWVKAKPQGPD